MGILSKYPSSIFVYSPLLILLTLIGVAIPFATGLFINSINFPDSYCLKSLAFHFTFIILATLLLVKALLTPLLDRFICSRSRKVETDLQFRVLEATMNLSPSRLATIPDGAIIAKMTRDSYAVGSFVRGLYPRLLQAVVIMLATSCAIYSRSRILCLSFLIFFPLAIILFLPFARRFTSNSHYVRKQSDVSFNAIFDFLLTLPLLRTLDVERRFANAPQVALEGLKASNNATDTLSVRFGFFLGLMMVGGEIAVLGYAGSLAAKGIIPIGDVVLYQMLFISAIQAINGIISLLPELAALREGADSLKEMLDLTPPKYNPEPLAPLETLAFNRVTFAYPHSPNNPVLKDFCATFRAGTVIGLTGVNGAGKSTLLKLAVGALEPQAGEVLYNAQPLNEINLSHFRRRIGIVFQDNLLVTGTIRDNITLRDPNFTQEDIDKALALSGFDAVVQRLPDGLETQVGNHLRTLSGGERQRLAIARAIIRDPMILILDEATNHLDAESRKTVASLIAKLRPGRLILLAGHDEELNKLCDLKISCQIPKDGSYIPM